MQVLEQTNPEIVKPDCGELLLDRIRTATATIAVIGLGYVGLPMAMEFSRAGFRVIGLDTSEEKVGKLLGGESYVEDVPHSQLATALEKGFEPTSNAAALIEADAILICVPTPLRKSKDPDLGAVLGAAGAVARNMRAGQLIVLESTTYPGTTEEVLLPMFEEKGLRAGKDFWLAFSPERVDPGNAKYGVREITKLVGACTPAGTEMARELYSKVADKVVTVSSTRVAETAKLLENTFRSVNIALANEMAIICNHLGVNVWEVIDAAATKPFGFMAHYPGPGIGGHCIPLDPHYLSWRVRLQGYEPRFISLASEINESMPGHVTDLIVEGLNDRMKPIRGSSILIIGLAYKPNVGDTRESPALVILSELVRRGADVMYHDPYVERITLQGDSFTTQALTAELLRRVDCVVIATNHANIDYALIASESDLVVDTRNATRAYRGQPNIRYI